MPAFYAIYAEIGKVECEDAARVERFCRCHECSVGKVHWQIPILLDVFKAANQPWLIQRKQAEVAIKNKLFDPGRSLACGFEHVKHLGKNRFRRVQRAFNFTEHLVASPMVRILWIEEGDQRAGIDQRHRRARRRASFSLTTRRDSRADPIAYPPSPKSYCTK